MRNGAGGFPAFSSLPPVLPRSVITPNQAEQRADSAGPTDGLAACSFLSRLHSDGEENIWEGMMDLLTAGWYQPWTQLGWGRTGTLM